MNITNLSTARLRWLALLPLVIVLAVVASALFVDVAPKPAQAAVSISLTINAPPNLVVDSNVTAPSTYGPSAATVIGKFCNNTGSTIYDATGYIGDYNPVTPANSTPGTYPVRANPQGLVGNYSLTHIGGSQGGSVVDPIPDKGHALALRL